MDVTFSFHCDTTIFHGNTTTGATHFLVEKFSSSGSETCSGNVAVDITVEDIQCAGSECHTTAIAICGFIVEDISILERENR